MGLIDGEKRYVHSLHPQAEGLGCEPFGSDVEEFHVAVDAVVQRDVDGPGREARMDRHGREAPCPETIDLVFHQGDEGCNDNTKSTLGESGHLECDRFTTSGRH